MRRTGGYESRSEPPARLPRVDPRPAPGARADKKPLPSDGPEYHADLAFWQQRQPQSSGGMIVDGVGYTPGQIRRLVQERHLLAEENTRLNLRVDRLQRAAESQQVHLQRRTAALIRLIARKGPVL